MAWEDLTEVDKAWLAGIFEGEGSIYVYTGSGKTKKYIRILFYNNDISMLDEIKRLIGGNIHRHGLTRKDSWEPSYQLQLGKKKDIKMFLKEIKPFIRSNYKLSQTLGCVELANENGGGYD